MVSCDLNHRRNHINRRDKQNHYPLFPFFSLYRAGCLALLQLTRTCTAGRNSARRFFIDVRIAVTAVHPHAFRVVCIQTVIFITLGIVESAVHAAAVYNSSITQSASFHVGVPLLYNHFGCSACKPAQINLLRPASEVMIPHQMAFCTVLLGAITILYGSSLERSRGNNVVSRTFSSPQSFIVNRSRPMPSPP